MARLTIGQKAQRVLKLLLGLRNPRVAEALGSYGFSQSDLEEGWTLMRALTGGRLAQQTVRRDPSLLEQLDAWENRWFPIASASLVRRFPSAHAWLFLNLTQTEGAEVIVSVGTFLDRLARLETEPSLGADGPAARALLTARGLSPATVDVAQDLLRQLGTTEPAAVPAPISAEVAAQAEHAMWSWYLEWGEIARVAVKDRRLLRELGFLNVKRSLAEEVVEEEGEPDAVEDAGEGEDAVPNGA